MTAKKCKVRGAYSREAFATQEAKIVSAINALGADVVALEEIETRSLWAWGWIVTRPWRASWRP